MQLHLKTSRQNRFRKDIELCMISLDRGSKVGLIRLSAKNILLTIFVDKPRMVLYISLYESNP